MDFLSEYFDSDAIQSKETWNQRPNERLSLGTEL